MNIKRSVANRSARMTTIAIMASKIIIAVSEMKITIDRFFFVF